MQGWINATATYEGVEKTGTAAVTVAVPQPVLDHIVVTPESTTLILGQSCELSAKAYDTHGRAITRGVTYQWSVIGSIGDVSPQNGQATIFTARTNGTGKVKVTATFNSVVRDAYADVTVSDGTDSPPKIVHTPITTAQAGTDIIIKATVTNTDATPVQNVTLYYRKKGDEAWFSLPMSKSSAVYSAKIPAHAVSIAGLQYKIVAEDTAGLRTYSAGSPMAYHSVIVTRRGGFAATQPVFWFILLIIVAVVYLLDSLLVMRRWNKRLLR